MNGRVQASAVVTVTVEVPVRSSWGPDATVDQVHRQASENGLDVIGIALRSIVGARVVGQPVVRQIYTEVKP